MSTETEPAAEQTRPAPPSEDTHFIASVVGAAGDHDAPLLRRLLATMAPPDLADVVVSVHRRDINRYCFHAYLPLEWDVELFCLGFHKPVSKTS